MGMAASQARFLGLTARKTNTEYEGQQVNQQRTALANQSAGLFNQMMVLEVPTPPNATDYHTMCYTYTQGNEKKEIISYSAKGDGTYDINVRTATNSINYNPVVFGGTDEGDDNVNGVKVYRQGTDPNYTYYATFGSSTVQQTLNKKTAAANDPIYPKDTVYYEFSYNGINYSALATATSPEKGIEDLIYDTDGKSEDVFNGKRKDTTTHVSEDVISGATFISGASGRFEYVTLPPGTSQIELTMTEISDDVGYNKAMNDYYYKKDVYEKTIADINAKTEIIQAQDRTLELRLKQLDTEQEALTQEMEAIKKVIDKNVETTFKTFA